MAQQPSIPHTFLPHEPLDTDGQVLRLATRFGACVPTDARASSASRPATRARSRVTTRAIREALVIEVSGRLSDVVEDLDRAIQLALAGEPRGVVCDLSSVSSGLRDIESAAVEVLATAGRHVSHWPGVPVVVVCPDPQVRKALRAHPLGGHLIVTESLFSAVSAVLSTPALTIERLRLAPHPTAPRASRGFLTRTLLDWHLHRVVPFARLVLSELVVCSSINASTDIDLSVVWDRGALRLAVRDDGPGSRAGRHRGLGLHGRGLTVVAGLSRAFGVMPTANGGTFAWAVLDAPRRSSPTSQHRPAIERQEVLILNDARARAEKHSRRITERGLR